MLDPVRLLRDLVALPSVNPMGRPLSGPEVYEHRVTDYLESVFRDLGVRYERQHVAPLRDNILAFYEPPNARSTLILEVHQDTVPTDHMTIDPYGAEVRGGRLYGRGACDVKGGMASMVAAFARLTRDKPAGALRVVLACSVDEEATLLGVRRMARDDLSGGCPGPVRAVVAEPTGLDIVHAHKGVLGWALETAGRACHASRPELGVNAVYRMALLLPLIEQYADELRATRHHPVLGPATLSVGRIDGGISVNTVPGLCRIEIDRRLLPGERADDAPAELLAYLRARVEARVEFSCSPPWVHCPALNPVGSESLTRDLGHAIDAVVGRHEVRAVAYGTDASTLAEAGVPSVVFGPGDIAQAHTRDEWVELAQVEQAAEILYRLACAG